jgi:hypothetical protein
MTNDDRELKQWEADWQAAPSDSASAEQIRRYVSRRSRTLWSFAVMDLVVGGVALPILLYIGWTTESAVERMAMLGLASITIAAVIFGWWNHRGVLGSRATTTAEYVAISVERLRRMRLACVIGWIVLAAEVMFFVIWIWDHLYSGQRPYDAAAERFAWRWLAGMTILGAAGLAYFGRWVRRDARRFEALRRELESD